MEFSQAIVIWLILVLSITVHEWAHCAAANALGDPTARALGRLTLNPLSHIDPIGTVAIPLFNLLLAGPFSLIGWGRPAPFNAANFPGRQRAFSELLVTLAGPASNLVLAGLLTVLLGLTLRFGADERLVQVVSLALTLNLGLVVFNLIPVPPLDGGRVLKFVTGMGEEAFATISSVAPFVLLVAINLPAFRGALGAVMAWVAEPFIRIAVWIGYGV